MNVFDIETGPLSPEKLCSIMPKFDPNEVKLGNLKDAGKIKEKILEAEMNHVTKFYERAALSAITGQVKAIGFKNCSADALWIAAVEPLGVNKAIVTMDSEQPYNYCTFTNEPDLLGWYWDLVRQSTASVFAGHNIHGFDLPFLIRRSWVHGVKIPNIMKGRYFHDRFVDTMALWNCGGRDYVKLDEISQFFGGPSKPDDCSGADFARMFDAGGEERKKAIDYLIGDLTMTQTVAEAMGII